MRYNLIIILILIIKNNFILFNQNKIYSFKFIFNIYKLSTNITRLTNKNPLK